MSDEHATWDSFPVLDLQGPAAVELTIEERYETLFKLYRYQYFAIFKLVGERFGWQAANDIAYDMAAEAIPFIAQGYKRKFGLPGEGAALVSQTLCSEFQTEGGDFSIIGEETEDHAEYTVQCAIGQAALQSGKYDDVPISEGLCTRGCWQWTQQVADSVSEGLKVDRPEWIGDGAPRCRFVISRAGSTTAAP